MRILPACSWRERPLYVRNSFMTSMFINSRVFRNSTPVDAADVVEHDVMIGPYLPDQQEGEDVGQAGQSAVRLRSRLWRLGPGGSPGQAGDGDRDDRVAERGGAPRIALRAERCWSACGHGSVCGARQPRTTGHRRHSAQTAPSAKTMIARRKAGGDGGMEALRILKRRLSDVVYRALQADAAPPSTALTA
jgi:hypothetical protein